MKKTSQIRVGPPTGQHICPLQTIALARAILGQAQFMGTAFEDSHAIVANEDSHAIVAKRGSDLLK